MADLPAHCAPCEGGVAPLDEAAARERMEHVPGWTLEPPVLRRSWKRRDFRDALAFVNRVGALAEEEGHHPDVHLTGWNRVELVLSTHAIGGLSDNDFVLARRIGELEEAR